jgi:hypothetical protein
MWYLSYRSTFDLRPDICFTEHTALTNSEASEKKKEMDPQKKLSRNFCILTILEFKLFVSFLFYLGMYLYLFAIIFNHPGPNHTISHRPPCLISPPLFFPCSLWFLLFLERLLDWNYRSFEKHIWPRAEGSIFHKMT